MSSRRRLDENWRRRWLDVPKTRVAVVGLGLLGGSIGLALSRSAGRWHVVGVDRDEGTVGKAIAAGAVDAGTTDIGQGVHDADLVVFATPVRTVPDLIRTAAPGMKSGAVVTDVGSTKAELCRTIPPLLPPGVVYIGGHPMAGSELKGFDAADPYLFENAVYVLTPATNDAVAMRRVLEFVEALGAQPLVLEAARHDRIVAAVSHLPHLVAAALVNAVADAAAADAQLLALAAGGFRDTTRIASGDPALWRDICMTNREPLTAMLNLFQHTLARLRGAVEAGDDEELHAQLEAARATREQLPRHRKGILSTMYELVVQLEDRPGAISEVTACLAAKQINIKDIEILRVREGEGGTLRLALESEDDVERSLDALAKAGFFARRRG